ncbi:hypothetical protein ISCGN_027255 [Ixodes scapularis]
MTYDYKTASVGQSCYSTKLNTDVPGASSHNKVHSVLRSSYNLRGDQRKRLCFGKRLVVFKKRKHEEGALDPCQKDQLGPLMAPLIPGTGWTSVYEKRGPKWCIASPGRPRRVQTCPGLGSTTRIPFSPDTGKPRTARRGRANPHGSGSVETPLSKHLLSQEFRDNPGLFVITGIEMSLALFVPLTLFVLLCLRHRKKAEAADLVPQGGADEARRKALRTIFIATLGLMLVTILCSFATTCYIFAGIPELEQQMNRGSRDTDVFFKKSRHQTRSLHQVIR